MPYYDIPQFFIKKNMQKSSETGKYFSDIVTPCILKDVCVKITGLDRFAYRYVDNDYEDDVLRKSYNKGRLAILKYRDVIHYISFSEDNIAGRNSSVQSVPTAFNIFYMNPYPRKKLYYYFLNAEGNAGTEYQIMMYRLMKTIGFTFLNDTDVLRNVISGFASIDDIMHTRRANALRNISNNSSYITKSAIDQFDIYGKTYGASKYETSMMCYALSTLASDRQRITLYEILEQNLRELPASSLAVIKNMPNIQVVKTDMQLERRMFDNNTNLRSPHFIYNLLEKFGEKHCALCDCEIPEIIQGAHIWSIAAIKRTNLSIEEKLSHATDGNNGLWLCENHHKMFDQGIVNIDNNGCVRYADTVDERHIDYLNRVTLVNQLSESILTDGFLRYLELRNNVA